MTATLKVDTIKEVNSSVDNLALDSSGNVTIGNNLTVTGTTTQTGSATFTAQTLFPDGSVSAPSISNTGDVNTGVYFPAADNVAIATGGVAALTADSSQNVSVTNTLAMGSSFLRNRIINGACVINQRGSSLSTNNSYGYYVDRMWGFSGASTAATYSQISSTGLAGFPYAMRAQRNSGNTGTGGVYTGQIVESNNLQDLQGQPVSISFWARKGADYSGSSNQLNVTMRTGTVADQGLATLVSPGWTGSVDQTSAVTLTTSWQRFTVTTFTVGSSVQELTVFFQPPPTASTAGTNDYYDVTGVQLEVGSVATPFERRQYGQELALCQRYYYRQTPAATTALYGQGIVDSSTVANGFVVFPVPMRTSPTALEQSGTASHYRVQIAGNVINCTSVPTFNSADTWFSSVVFTTTSSLGTAGNAALIRANSTSGYLAWSAEL